MRHRTLLLLLLLLLLFLSSSSSRRRRSSSSKNHLPGRNTMPLKEEKSQNCTPKMPNVTSETHRK